MWSSRCCVPMPVSPSPSKSKRHSLWEPWLRPRWAAVHLLSPGFHAYSSPFSTINSSSSRGRLPYVLSESFRCIFHLILLFRIFIYTYFSIYPYYSIFMYLHQDDTWETCLLHNGRQLSNAQNRATRLSILSYLCIAIMSSSKTYELFLHWEQRITIINISA